MSSPMTITVSATLSEDEKTATVRLSTRSKPIVCGCLAIERDNQGNALSLYLDSLIHSSSKEVEYLGYKLSGAISTILVKV